MDWPVKSTETKRDENKRRQYPAKKDWKTTLHYGRTVLNQSLCIYQELYFAGYQEVRQYLLSRDWGGLKQRSVLKVWEQLLDKHSEKMQNS